MLNIDPSWRHITSPDFSPYDGMDPDRKILLTGADLFFPDPCLPAHVIEATKRALDEGRTHYSLANGYAEPELREALVRKLATFNQLEVDPDTELLVVPSSAMGLYLGIRVCVRPNMGDEVLNIEPGFSENINDVLQIGAVNVPVPVREETGFHLELDVLESKITERTRCIVLTNPNNPTGTVYDREELLGLADILERHNLIAVVDQDFERQVYDKEYVTFATLPGMRERTISVFGTSKDLGLTGYRVAYMVVPKELFPVLKPAIFNVHGPTAARGRILLLGECQPSGHLRGSARLAARGRAGRRWPRHLVHAVRRRISAHHVRSRSQRGALRRSSAPHRRQSALAGRAQGRRRLALPLERNTAEAKPVASATAHEACIACNVSS